MAMESCREKVMVLCYWNGCVKYCHDGVYYEGSSTPKNLTVKRKTKLNRLLDGIYLITGLDKEKSKFKIFGRYPSVSQKWTVKYLLLPVVDNNSLERMLEVPSNHPSINNVELYLEVKSEDVTNPGSSSKRQRIQEEIVNSGVLKPCIQSRLWIYDDHDMRLGLCFKDRDELKKAVDWWSIKAGRNCVVRETEKDMWTFECVRWKCKWSLRAARLEEHGLVEITKYAGPHTCDPGEDFASSFEAYVIERVVRVHPTLSIPELKKWWKEKTGYELETSKMQDAKLEVIRRFFEDSYQSFRVLPKLMSALHSSNRLVMDWQYDVFPNPEYASFCGVFLAFSQSIEGFQHCRPLILVDTQKLNVYNQLKLMIASGLDAANKYFPRAFAVTKEVTADSWRWFLTGIREKVTQRKGLCFISSPHPDILAVINEPGSLWQEPWAYQRFCLKQLWSELDRVFPRYKNLESLVKKAGSTNQKEEFDSYMKDIKEKHPEAWRWLDKFPPHQWALAHDNGLRYGIMEIDT